MVHLQIKAIKLNPNSPFTWASGWKSPIYCDNRVTLSYPPVRNFLKEQIGTVQKAETPSLSNVATAALSQDDMIAGLKQALEKGVGHAVDNLGKNYKKLIKLYTLYGFTLVKNDGKTTTMEFKCK